VCLRFNQSVPSLRIMRHASAKTERSAATYTFGGWFTTNLRWKTVVAQAPEGWAGDATMDGFGRQSFEDISAIADQHRQRNENVDWTNRSISYCRQKTGTLAIQRFGPSVQAILQRLPDHGPLFPHYSRLSSADRPIAPHGSVNGARRWVSWA